MTRSDFLNCCTLGMCSCVAVTSLTEPAAAQTANPAFDELKWKVDAAQKRFAKLVGLLDQHLDAAAKKKLFESLGRECSQDYKDLVAKYRNNIKGFLGHIQSQWVEKVDYDEKAGTIRIVDKSPTCTCPLVKQGVTPPDFCNCTLGWQKATYSAILGRPVEAELEESILRGGTRCVFRIRVA